jgi:CRP-like cAMP-binding protein
VKLSCLDIEGNEAIVGIAAPGMSFGGGLSSLEIYQAIALGEVRLNQFLLSDLEASAELSQTLVPSLIQRSKQTESLLAVAGQRKVEVRLQHLLLLLAQTVGQPIAGGTRIGVRITHEELASMIRSSRVSVTRLLGQFKRQGWLAVDRKRHLIVKQVVLVDLEEEFGVFKLNPPHSESDN